jgi:hypothetical protein
MSAKTIAKVTSARAAEICANLDLKGEAPKLLQPDLTPRQFLDVLLEKKLYKEAISFLAHALPKREAVWWACLCVRQAGGPGMAGKELAALKAAVGWVLDPTEDNRRAAEEPGKAADFSTAAGCAAMAAFWSDGSLNPPNLPAVPPDPLMTAQAVAGSVQLGAVQEGPLKVLEMQRRFLDIGIGVAEGQTTWPSIQKGSSR